jgi:hypothetical protein
MTEVMILIVALPAWKITRVNCQLLCRPPDRVEQPVGVLLPTNLPTVRHAFRPSGPSFLR